MIQIRIIPERLSATVRLLSSISTSTRLSKSNQEILMNNPRLPLDIVQAKRSSFSRLAFFFLALLAATHAAFSGSATWNLNPTSTDWNTAANWTPETVPNGTTDIATFDVSDVTDVLV